MTKRIVVLAVCALTLSAMGFAQTSGSGFRIAGTVVDANTGRPLSKTRVMLSSTAARTEVTSYITGQDGRFVFSGLSKGKYSLGAERQGYPGQGLDRHDTYATAVAVGPDLDSQSLVFRLQPAAAINGRISDENDEPIRDASVMLFRRDSITGTPITRLIRTVESDDLGMYHFQNLLAGKYFVAVAVVPWFRKSLRFARSQLSPALDVAYPVTFYPGVPDWRAATALNIKFGQRFAGDFRLHTVPSIHARIRQGNNARAVIPKLFMPVFDGPEATVPIDFSYERENLEVVGVAPGRYILELPSAQDAALRTEVEWNGDTTITSEQLAAEPHTASIAGALKFDADTPSFQTDFVLLNVATRQVARARIDSEGNFNFASLPLGTYEAHIGNSAEYWVWGLSADYAVVNGTRFTINSPVAIRLSAVATRAVGTIDGMAQANGKPKAGCMIVLVPENLANVALYRRDQSDSDGTFTLRSVLPGNYTVIAIDNWDVEWTNPELLKKYLSAGERVHVSGNDTQNVQVHVD